MLHANVGQPEFVQFLPVSRICPTYVQVMTKIWLCLTFVQALSHISNFCPLFDITGTYKSNLCPVFVPNIDQNSSANCWTPSGHIMECHNFSCTTWSPCIWTKNGQTLDIGCWTISRQTKDKVSGSKMGHGPWPTAHSPPITHSWMHLMWTTSGQILVLDVGFFGSVRLLG